ncbi:ABC transporter permease [Rhizobium sp. SSA_523]|uniref:ABC transporter permease n=1 Tax=Rhizobium sp. SSA_523 TaxID=2952477 RepID=UPI002091A784|nr:ABC-2 family transporter protein [Rhizobium sp. SSA_523]MCO5733548.1 ABC transporter permease [Rhizobium sp. SSA_523]WKC23149.1 ABC-2 family transporter protein [Rhizobium sp. SSA_523]
MRETLSLLLYLVRLRVRTRLQFRASLMIAWVAQAFGYAGVFTQIWLILTRFETIGGWTWPQMALLLGFHTLGYALGACFTLVQLRRMEEIVLGGEFDTLLVRPLNPWAYLVFSGFNIEYGGHILLGAGLIAWALPQLAIDWGPAHGLFLILGLVSAALITASLITMLGACAMLLGRARYLFGIYFDFWELSRYPASIFAAPFQLALLSIIPLGYMAYVPVSVLLDRSIPYLGGGAAAAALAAGPLSVVAAAIFWRFCLDRYQGGGG